GEKIGEHSHGTFSLAGESAGPCRWGTGTPRLGVVTARPCGEGRAPLSLLRRRCCGCSQSAGIVFVRHAFFDERIARWALQLLVVSAELAGLHFVLRVDREGRRARQQHGEQRGNYRVSKHGQTPLMQGSHRSIDRFWRGGYSVPSLRAA